MAEGTGADYANFREAVTKKLPLGLLIEEKRLLECLGRYPGSGGVPFEAEHLHPAGLVKRVS